jgi:enoyl-CoA hydratase
MAQPSSRGSFETLLYEKGNAMAHLALNCPNVMGALNREATGELRYALDDVQADRPNRGAILIDAGDQAFIAGADIGVLSMGMPVDAERRTWASHELFSLVEHLGKLVIAAVNGLALSGGRAALARAIRLARLDARFAHPEAKELGFDEQKFRRLTGCGAVARLGA